MFFCYLIWFVSLVAFDLVYLLSFSHARFFLSFSSCFSFFLSLSCLLFSFSNCCLDFPLSFAAFSSFCRFKSSSTSVSVMQLAFAFTACFLVFSLVAIGFGKAKILLRELAVLSSQLEEDGTLEVCVPGDLP